MPSGEEPIRRSETPQPKLVRHVRASARSGRTGAGRVLVEIARARLAERDAEKRRLLELADRPAESADPAEQTRLEEELERLTFG